MSAKMDENMTKECKMDEDGRQAKNKKGMRKTYKRNRLIRIVEASGRI